MGNCQTYVICAGSCTTGAESEIFRANWTNTMMTYCKPSLSSFLNVSPHVIGREMDANKLHHPCVYELWKM